MSSSWASSVNDLGVFDANRLILNSLAPAFTISSTVGNSIRLSGAEPGIHLLGAGSVTISSPLTLNSEGGSVSITGEGRGHLSLSGVISEGAAPQSLVINSAPAALDQQIITLSGANTFTGGVTLNSGNLALNNAAALGTGPLTIGGGTLRLNSAFQISQDIPQDIVLKDTLVILRGGDSTLRGSISGAAAGAGLELRSSSGLMLTAASSYTGATTTFGMLRLAESASILQSSEIVVRGGTLRIDAVNGVTDRIGDATPVALHGGNLLFSGDTGGSVQTETIGPLSGAGYSTITAAPASGGGSTRLTAASVTRVERSTFLFRGASLGSSADLNASNILFATEPAGLTGGGGTGVNTSILPYAIGDSNSTGNGASFVTWTQAGGIRPLEASTEYISSLTGASTTSNVRLTTSLTQSGTRNINSLLLAGGSVTGWGVIGISSGAILSTVSASIAPAVAFGSTEGNVFAVAPLTISGVISGTNGLTKSGAGTLTLSANNPFTGPLTINRGSVSFHLPANLGADASHIVVGSGAGLHYSGAAAITLDRGIHLTAGTSSITLGSSVSGSLTLSGPITGAGGLQLSRGSGPAGAVIALTGANTYTGPTLIRDNLDVIINSDSALGAGGALTLAGSGKLILAGAWQTSRDVLLLRSNPFTRARIDTAGFEAILGGALSGNADLEKLGDGPLRIMAASTFSGLVTIERGSIELAGPGSLMNTWWGVRPGAELTVDNRSTALDHRLRRNVVVALGDSAFTMHGNGLRSLEERVGFFVIYGESTVNLLNPGDKGVTLRAGSINIAAASPPGALVIRGENLAGAAGGAFTRLLSAGFVSPPSSPIGFDFHPRVYIADAATGVVSSFSRYDSAVDAAGEIGFRALGASEYATGIIRNPAQGGDTPETAHFLAGSGTTAVGATNTIATLTIEPDGTLTLDETQTLRLSAGNILARSGAAPAEVHGGVLDFGDYFGTIFNSGDLLISSDITSGDRITKLGAGTLTLSGTVRHLGGIETGAGILRLNPGSDLRGLVQLHSGASLEANGPSAVGALAGAGGISLASGALAVGAMAGDFVIEGAIAGPGSLVIHGGPTGAGIRRFISDNTFSGGVTLESGRLSPARSSSLGTGILTINGGMLYGGKSAEAAPQPIVVPITLNADLRTGGFHSITLADTAVVSGAGAVEVRDRGNLIIQSATAHTGETRSVFGFAESISAALGTISVSGPQGSIAASSGARIGPEGMLLLDNTTMFSGGVEGRVGDAASIHLQSAALRLVGNISITTVERFGILTSSGFSTVTVLPGSSANARLEGASLDRVDRGTFWFFSSGMGGAFANNVGNILFATAPGPLIGGGGSGADISILPYAIGGSFVSPSGFVTYDSATGVRALNETTEYASSLGAATPTNNVRLSGILTNTASITINSLLLNSANSMQLQGAGALRISSGALLMSGYGTAAVSNSLDFGEAEANIFTLSLSYGPPATLSLLGAISGSGGLTKSGGGVLVLAGANTLSGPITINGGTIQFSAPENLGVGALPIVINGSVTSTGLRTGLRYVGPDPLVFSRSLEVRDGFASLSTSQAPLIVTGIISGRGGLQISSRSIGDHPVELTGANTYEGPTLVNGTLNFTSEAALGLNDRLIIAGGTLRLLNDAVINRTIELSETSKLDTAEFDATLNGKLIARPTVSTLRLVKQGSGAVKINDASEYYGGLVIEAGKVVMNGRLLAGDAIDVGISGTLAGTGLIQRWVRIDGMLAPGDESPGMLTTGELIFGENSTLALEIASSTQFDQVQVNGRVQLNGTINLTLDLRYDPADGVDSFTVIANDGMDAVAGSGVARFAFGGAVLNEWDSFTAGGQEFRISYAGGTGNDVVLYAVPEPGAAGLLLAGGLLLLRRRRRGGR